MMLMPTLLLAIEVATRHCIERCHYLLKTAPVGRYVQHGTTIQCFGHASKLPYDNMAWYCFGIDCCTSSWVYLLVTPSLATLDILSLNASKMFQSASDASHLSKVTLTSSTPFALSAAEVSA